MITPPRSKGFLLFAAALAVAAAPAQVFAFAEFGRGLFLLETSVTGTYDSYFIGSRDNDPDYYGTFRPQLKYERVGGVGKFSAFAGVAINRYVTNTRYDSEDLLAGVNVTLPFPEGSRLTGSGGASYSEATTADPIINDRIRSESLVFNASGQYITGLKTSLSESFHYNQTYRDIYSDQTIWSNDLSFAYREFLEDTTLRLSHGFVKTESTASNYPDWVYDYDPQLIGLYPDSGLDQTSNSISLGVSRPVYGSIIGEVTYGYRVLDRKATETNTGETRTRGAIYSLRLTGPFLPPARFPKVESSASISYESATSPGVNDSGGKTVTGSVRLSWEARERTTLSFSANRSYELSANNLTVVVSQVSASVTEQLGLKTTLTGNLSYIWRDYRGIDRQDSVLEAGLTARRPVFRHWSIAGSYLLQVNSTEATNFQPSRYELGDYTRHLLSVTITNVF